MSDLIERLRQKASVFVAKDCQEAADELERLQASDLTHREQRDNWRASSDHYQAENEKLRAVVDAAKNYTDAEANLYRHQEINRRMALLIESVAALEEDDGQS